MTQTATARIVGPAPATEDVQPVIVGLGHAGTNFHLRPLETHADHFLSRAGVRLLPPMVVDPRLSESRRLADLAVERRGGAIVHISATAVLNTRILTQAYELGYRRFLVEKPLCIGFRQIEEMEAIARADDIKIVVVTNWLFSRLTRLLARRIAEHGGPDAVVTLEMHQHKPRFSRTRSRTVNPTAFEVELPHMLGLTAHLLGPRLTLVSSACEDLVVGETHRYEALGSVTLRLTANAGTPATLLSDLRKPTRERWVDLRFRDGARLRGYFPCSSDDCFSHLATVDEDGGVTVIDRFEDNTVQQMLRETYDYFLGIGDRPVSTPEFHLPMCRLLAQARATCGLKDPEPE
ncbi:hypothetical protein [Roseospira visakhapatnamensis]|uniref:Dehydrogenase n=1 Tax=Roseospira visakhapatnamensis TaxID=390880 RepID=A0A7W6RAK4_9PROT|nr:hypothetical protein [Roseospira visakhapatnamensis]MBB4264586.1 hypothetical protein [Roseospira visakhapatnamensis]